jgi:hypothetical protein
MRDESADLFKVFNHILVQLVHAWIQRRRNAKNPQLEVFNHGFDCQRSKEQLIPNQLDDFPDCRPID